jgi:hypothetical protein
MKHGKKWLAGATLGTALALAAPDASAQNILGQNTRRMAAILNMGGYIGIAGGGVGGLFRLNPEFHYSFGEGMRGPALGVGLDMYIPGFGLGANARFQWNIQPIDNVAFLITPYGGVTAGGFFGGGGGIFFMGIHFGGELRLILADRGFLTFRPIGFSVPIYIGGPIAGAGFAYDVAFGGGVTF